MLDAGVGQRLVESLDVLARDRLVGAAHQRQDRRGDVREALDAAGAPVEADRAREAVARRGGVPRVRAAEAEADGEDRAAALVAQEVDGGADVGLDARLCRLLDVLAVGKVLPALCDARGAAEVIDRDRAVATLGEAQSELFVEAVETAHVREDDDADVRRLVGRRVERREARAVGRLELEVLVRDGGAGDHGNRRQ